MDLHRRDLGQDVRELGALLGHVIRSQSSDAAFEAVETVRTTSIDYRRGDRTDRAPIHETYAANDAERNAAIARAFTTYFTLTNLAEERERVREIRRNRQAGDLEHSIESTIAALLENGADHETIGDVLADVSIEPTFTAHPTEARRKTVKTKLRRIADHVKTLDERALTDEERERLWDAVEAELVGLWTSKYVRNRKPEPLDEARNVQWYLENTLFDAIPDTYARLEAALADAFDVESVDVPSVFELRSWAGADRDGNPNVTPGVTAETLERQQSIVVEQYRDRLGDLSAVLSQDGTRVDVGDPFERLLARDRDRFPGLAGTAAERYPDEPYRQKVALIREQLDRVGDVRPGGYDDADAFVADLGLLADSLRESGCAQLAEVFVDPVLRAAETFGFVFASLDLRDHRENHTETVAATLATEGIEYAAMDEAERVELLTTAILDDDPVIDLEALAADDGPPIGETPRRVCRRFSALVDWHREYGADAIDAYCISMCERPSHVLELLFLADQAGVVDLPGYSGLDLVPLLETKSALTGARRIMGTLFENEAYAAALAARGNTQEVMIGYSDSNKENGFLTANWALYNNQRRLPRICEEYGVELRLFHGRGGSISRGGGPMNEAMLALPRETVTGEIKFTEQGEAISEKYANPAIARRELEQMLDAQMRARHDAMRTGGTDLPDAWLEAVEEMAGAAREAYRDLLEREGFVEYYERATPITVIENLALGSRPASRTGERTVRDLRAIPWVFAWTQSRCIVPGWYGVGTGIERYLDSDGDLETLREMYREWPFFRTTLDRAATAMARTEMGIAAEYADLAGEDLRERFFPDIRAEYERSVEHTLAIVDREDLLNQAWLRESLDRRNPYVDPLNLLQVRLLDRRHRTDQEERTLRMTVAGIAAGMQNTG